VGAQRPTAGAAVGYWRSVALTHARQYEQAAVELAGVLDPTASEADNGYRNGILLHAWQLALVLHPELNRRVGTPELSRPRRRMEAIAAVERKLKEVPDDADAWTLKRLLYSGLTEQEYLQSVRSGSEGPNGQGGFEYQGLEH